MREKDSPRDIFVSGVMRLNTAHDLVNLLFGESVPNNRSVPGTSNQEDIAELQRIAGNAIKYRPVVEAIEFLLADAKEILDEFELDLRAFESERQANAANGNGH